MAALAVARAARRAEEKRKAKVAQDQARAEKEAARLVRKGKGKVQRMEVWPSARCMVGREGW